MKEFLIKKWRGEGISEEVLSAFKKVKREDFVLPRYKEIAYKDIPLEIISGQTISQPSTVILMTNALEVKKGMKILEVGAGSGYQAALLSKLVGSKGKIFSIEINKELVEFAKKNLKKAKIKNVDVIHGDGSLGYDKEAFYDRIIITAACPVIPSFVNKQLKKNGVAVLPVGSGIQRMIKIKNMRIADLGDFVFVPLRGKCGF